jgi:hypothetical protein
MTTDRVETTLNNFSSMELLLELKKRNFAGHYVLSSISSQELIFCNIQTGNAVAKKKG